MSRKPTYFTVRNFEQYQHYSQRNPPWIKLYYRILHDRNFYRLSDSNKYLTIGLFLLASQHENCTEFDTEWIRKELSLNSDPDLISIEKAGFIKLHYASKTLARRMRDAISKQRREETDKETETESASNAHVEEFWEAYPRKENKQRAEKEFIKLNPKKELLKSMIEWLNIAKESRQWSDREFIPHPSTWLHQKRWESDPPPKATKKSDHVGKTDPDLNGNDPRSWTLKNWISYTNKNGVQASLALIEKNQLDWPTIKEIEQGRELYH